MDDPIVLNAVLGGASLGVAALAGLFRRHWFVGVTLGLAGLAVLLGFDLMPGGEHGLLWEPAATALAWMMLGHVGRVAGGPILSSSWGFSAVMAGWLLGDWSAALLFAGLCGSPALAARCALVASGAALMSPIGTPASLLLIDSSALGPLPLGLALVAWPRATVDKEVPKGSLVVTLVLAAVAGGVNFFPEYRLGALVLGIAALAGLNRLDVQAESFPVSRAGFLVAAMVVAWIVRLTGVARDLLDGLLVWVDLASEWGWVSAAGGGLLAGALLGEPGGALVLQEVLESTAAEVPAALPLVMAAGLSVGGLGPLILSGGFREGWRIWLLQVALVLGWAGVMLA